MNTTKQIMKMGTAALLALLLGAPATGLADKAPPPKKEAKDAEKTSGKEKMKEAKKDPTNNPKKDPPPAAGW